MAGYEILSTTDIQKSMEQNKNGDKPTGIQTAGDKSVGNNSKKSPGRTKKDKKTEDKHTGIAEVEHEETNEANSDGNVDEEKGEKITKGYGVLTDIANQIGADYIHKLCELNKCTIEELAHRLDPMNPDPAIQEQIGAGEGTPASEVEHYINNNPKQALGTNPQQKI